MLRRNLNPDIKVLPKTTYWTVFWGPVPTTESINKHPEALRMAFSKYADPIQACVETFGMATENMWVCDMGSIASHLKVLKFRREKWHNPENWIRVGKPGTRCDSHWHCTPESAHNCEQVDRNLPCSYCGQKPEVKILATH